MPDDLASVWPRGDGEMAGRIRAFDWSQTSLGPIKAWSERLATMVEQVLANPAVSSLVCGPDHVLIYNDAAARLYGDRHPGALGQPLPDAFPEGWRTVAPFYERVFAGEAVQVAGQPLDTRGEEGEETDVFDALLLPVRDADGRVAYALMIGFEVSERARSEARLREAEERQAFVLKLSDALRPIGDPVEIQRTATRMLGEHLKANRVFYVVIDKDGDTADILGDYTDGVSSRVGRYSLSAFSTYAVGEWRVGRNASSNDVNVDPRYSEAERQAYASVSTRAGFGIPLIKEGRLVALLGVNQSTPRRWIDHDFDLAGDTAERVWAAVERARAEAELRNAQAALAAAFESVPVGVAAVDLSGKTVISNAEYRRLLPNGVVPSRDPERGARWRGWDPQGQPLERHDYPAARAMRGESVVPGQEMLYTDDEGREIWTSVATVPTRDDRGRVTGLITAMADIDATKRGAHALRESEERLRGFGEASTDVLWIRDPETLNWTYLTPAFETIYGLSREEALVGDNFHNWVDLIVPEDRDLAMDTIRRVGRGESVTFEYRIRRPSDGAIRWLRNTDFPIRNAEGRITAIGGVGHDASQEKEADRIIRASRRELRTLVEGVPTLVWRGVDSGEWTWASPQWMRFTGQSTEASIGRGWLAVVHPDDRERAMEAWQAAERTEEPLEAEYRIRQMGGETYRWFQTRALPVRDEDTGTILEWLGTSTDIDDMRQLQEEQTVMVAELQHRTRNLIGVVGSIARQTMAHTGPTEAFQQEFMDRLEALSRVQGLLSRAGDERITIRDIVEMELTALGAASSGGRTTLEGPDVPLRKSTVQTMSLAIHELATNARKYGALADGHGELLVRWSTGRAEPADRRLFIEWIERGVEIQFEDGKAVVRGGGYGRRLIEKSLPYSLKAKTTYELGPDGLRCTIDLPLGKPRTRSRPT